MVLEGKLTINYCFAFFSLSVCFVESVFLGDGYTKNKTEKKEYVFH
jgi:hypothetical protein